jgi:hypothetical protein
VQYGSSSSVIRKPEPAWNDLARLPRHAADTAYRPPPRFLNPATQTAASPHVGNPPSSRRLLPLGHTFQTTADSSWAMRRSAESRQLVTTRTLSILRTHWSAVTVFVST